MSIPALESFAFRSLIPDEMRMSTKHVRSAADLARFKCGLKIECGGCGNSRTLDGNVDVDILAMPACAAIQQRMKYSRCGAKEAWLTVLSPPGPR